MSNITLWQAENNEIIPRTAKTPSQISDCAVQLGTKDKRQIISAFESGHYEMAMNYLWNKTIIALKKALATVGIELLGEMLGKTDVDESDDVDAIVTTSDAIRLASELGVISSTEAMRLRHTYEIINHFSQLEMEESDLEEIEEEEALSSLKICVRSILGKPKIEVAKKFVEFRNMLEEKTLGSESEELVLLKNSPYFFHKLTINVLLNSAKKSTSANLEHALANLNVLIPIIWENLKDAEKWQIGSTYAEVYAEGKSTSVKGLKSALLKVKGFDYVPETLRSETFIKAADAIIKAHESLNNFYNEPIPVKNFSKLGSTIPIPALPISFTALICISIGNYYNRSWKAAETSISILKEITSGRWEYYFKNIFPSDIKVLTKLQDDSPIKFWIKLLNDDLKISIDSPNKTIKSLLNATKKSNPTSIKKYSKLLLTEYYGK